MSVGRLSRAFALCLSVVAPSLVHGQGTAADYARSESLNQRIQGLSVNIAERPVWIAGTNRFWYRKSVKGGNEFVLVDASTQAKGPAFDQPKLAAAITAQGGQASALALPFTTFSFEGAQKITFVTPGFDWDCSLTDYTCNKKEAAAPGTGGGRGGAGGRGAGGRGGRGNEVSPDVDVFGDSIPNEGPWYPEDGIEAEVAAQRARAAAPQQVPVAMDTTGRVSADGTMEAYIQNYNIFIRPLSGADRGAGGRGGRGRGGAAGGGRGAAAAGRGGPPAPPSGGWQLSWDGSEGSPYVLGQGGNASLAWSPDSRHIAAWRVTPGYARYVHYVLSSPSDQLQPESAERYYQKPGDVVLLQEPALFDVTTKKETKIDNALFPNAYRLSQLHWWQDGRGFTFEYNQRGHQAYKIIEVNPTSGAARTLIDEESKTFIYYNNTTDGLTDAGRHLRRDLSDGKEIIWMSERDGWSHLYLYDGTTGRAKNQITKGNWRVQNVQYVDTLKRQVYFSATGMNAGQDPYLIHFYRINFDGTGLIPFTSENGTHTVTWSGADAGHSDYYVDSYTRVDMAPVSVLKRVSDQKVVTELEKGDISALEASGWKAPEVFSAKGRDGTTDIWGIIIKPSNFDPSKKYPVIEQIYAGPQGSFVPKSFAAGGATRALAELGFVVVQIDGMGTGSRSKAFHDVAFQNLGDAGFPDRILWHKAVAAKYPWYDITRAGIYGTSAGGQNALGGMLFHPEFYKVGFAAAGCHDNRMDKIWWNEQWMGWPIGPQYAASSNVDNAYKLQGKLMLYVGEYDTNVDPSSTMQVVNALIRANKVFDLIVQPGADHGNGGAYGVRKMTDFFVHNLLGVEPPDRNNTTAITQSGARGE